MELSIKGLALALGVAWGAGMLFLGVAGWMGWGGAMVEVLGSVYIGFAATPVGSVIGAAWGFVDGAVGGAIIAWVYNRLR